MHSLMHIPHTLSLLLLATTAVSKLHHKWFSTPWTSHQRWWWWGGGLGY